MIELQQPQLQLGSHEPDQTHEGKHHSQLLEAQHRQWLPACHSQFLPALKSQCQWQSVPHLSVPQHTVM